MQKAIEQDVDIINMSFGFKKDIPELKQLVNGNEKNIKKKSIKKDQTFIVTRKINKVTYKLAIYVDKKGKLTVSSFYPKS